MIRYFYEPDEQIEIAVFSDDENHKSIIKKMSRILGYEFEETSEEEVSLDVQDIALDRDSVIIKSNVFVEELLDLAARGVGVFII